MAALTCEQVEHWLEENTQWRDEYLHRKATVEFVLKWIYANEITCKQNGISVESNAYMDEDVFNNNADVQGRDQEPLDEDWFSDDSELFDEEVQATFTSSRTQAHRRFSEPGISSQLRQRLRLKRNHSISGQPHSAMNEESGEKISVGDQSSASLLLTNSVVNSKHELHEAEATPAKQRPGSMAQLGSLIESRIKLPSGKTLDQGMKLTLKHSNEEDFFYEIIKDIANNLDIKALSYNILVNIGILTNADRCSLFLVEGPKGRRTLVSELFDVHPICLRSTTKSSGIEIRVPWGKGIVGYAAETAQTVNIEDAYADSRFNQDVDKQTGYRTKSLLCTPITNNDGEVVGVAQLINKNPNAAPFNSADQELCDRYLPFCGIGITNAQLFETSQKEFQRNKVLIEMIHDIFEEQTSISKVINRVMRRSLKLMKCEHCSVMLLNEPLDYAATLKDKASESLKFSNNFHLKAAASGRNSVIPSNISQGLLDALTILSERLVLSPKTLCISDTSEDLYLKSLIGWPCDEIRSLISMPIRNSKSEILGVASLMNKINDCPFQEDDISLFEAIVLFCGLGINNTMLYDQMAKAKANQQVALEVLSYHAKSPTAEVDKLKLSKIPSLSSLKLSSMKFNDFSLDADEMLKASIRMFLDAGLINEFNIDYTTLCWWLSTLRKNYRNVIYHNWKHAFNVTQSMFAILMTGDMKQCMTKVECLALLVGCLCHDVDHRGTNNAFQEKIASPLSTLYGTSVMEHHHFNHTIMILNTEGHNIFRNLSSSDYRKVVSVLRHSILSTDLAMNFKYRSSFFPLVEKGELNLEIEEHRSMLRAMIMTACDLCGITKPWKIQRQVVNLVTSEFIQQGDIERERFNENEIPAIMDRKKKNELPKMQVQFFDSVGIPVFQVCAKVNPRLQPLLDGAIENRNRWEKLMNSMSK